VRGIRRWLAVGGWAVAFASAAGGTVVEIDVKTPPDLDPSLYKRIAVLPFAGDEDEGLLAAKQLREAMDKKGLFLVEPADTVEKALDRRGAFDPESREAALEVGRELGVDVVLVGKVHFFQRTYSAEGAVANELYTADRQTVPYFEFGSAYAQRNLDISLRYTVELTVKALVVDSGRLARRREFEATTTEAYKQSEVTNDPVRRREIFQDLLEKVVNDFTYTLDTHDVKADREVVAF
jgi:hypothetical protein